MYITAVLPLVTESHVSLSSDRVIEILWEFSRGAAWWQSRFTSGSLTEHTEGFSGGCEARGIYQTPSISDHYAVYRGIHITCVGSEERRHSAVR